MKKVLLSSFALVLIALTSWAIASKSAAPLKAEAELNLVDVTDEITNPQFDNGATGWTVKTGNIEVKGTSANPVVTAYGYKVDIYQTISGLKAGTYILKVQACSRYKDGSAGITDYESKIKSGTAIPNEAYIYANSAQQKIKNIYEETSTYDFASESGQNASNLTMSNGEQIPYNSTNFSRAFGEFGMYENELEFTVASDGVATIGIKNSLSTSSYTPYIAYDNFRLYRVAAEGEVVEPEGSDDPTTGKVELYNLNAPAGTLVPICMPYAVKSSYFGQVYQIGSIQNGTATIVPVDEVATGVPCVVKSNGASTIKKGDVTVDTSKRPQTFSLWDNTLMQAPTKFTEYTWTATDIYDKTINASDLIFVEGDLKDLDFTASIENNAVARFWAQNPTYLAETTSTVGNYLSLPVYTVDKDGYRRDKPNPVLVPVVVSNKSQTISYSQNKDLTDAKTVTVAANANVAEIYELIPGLTYYYKSADGKSAGKFKVSGTIRMLNIGTNVVNMRDLGGKQGFGGKYVRYGKIYRSAEFKGGYNINDTEKAALVALGIGAEMDLRNTDGGTSRAWIPNLVNNDNYFYAQNSSIIANGPARLYETVTINMLKKEFAFLFDNLITKGRAVQFHCRIGADRTGLFAFLIQGILGVSESDILREYELTSFSSAGLRTKAQGDSNGGNYQTELPNFKTKTEGDTFTGCFENYFKNTLGITKEQIKEFRDIMLVESLSPEEEVDPEDQEAQVAANTFKDTYKDVLSLTVDNVKSTDLENINAALDAYDKLSQKAQTYLTTVKSKLDQLKAAAELKAEIAKFEQDNAGILAKTTDNVESADLNAIYKALEDYSKLSEKAKAALADKNTLLGQLKDAAELKAEIAKFEKDNAGILAKTTENVEPNDLDAIKKALDDYSKLSENAQNTLADKNTLLGQLKAAAELKAEIAKFEKDNADILAKTTDNVEPNDLDAINKALEDYSKLSDKAKTALADKNTLLGQLKDAAELKAEIAKFEKDNAGILAKTSDNVDSADLAAIEKALADYNNLSDKAKEALEESKAKLDDLKKAAQTKKPEEGEDPAVIAEKKKVVEGLIEEVDAKITKWRKYNVGTAWGQYTCNHPEYITTAEAEVVKAEELIVGEPSIKELDDEIYALNASSAALDKVDMKLNLPKIGEFFYILSKKFSKYITLWPGHGANSSIKKAYGENPDWIMYDVTTNYSIFTINESGKIVQVLPGDKSYPGYMFNVTAENDVTPVPFDPYAKASGDNAEFTTTTDDPKSVIIQVGKSVISEEGDDVTAVALSADNADLYSQVEFVSTAGNPPVAGINDIKADVQNGNVYNIAGQRVSDDYQGIIIRDGKRLLVK